MTKRVERLIEIDREMSRLLVDAKRVRQELVSGISGFSASRLPSQVNQDVKTLAVLDADALLSRASKLTEMVALARALISEQRELDAAGDE